MMFKVICYYIFSYFTRTYTEITTCPEMSFPVSFFQHWKFFKQFAGRSSFDPAHDFTGRHCWRSRHKYVYMVFADHSFDYSYFKMLTRLPNQLPNSKRYVTFEYLVVRVYQIWIFFTGFSAMFSQDESRPFMAFFSSYKWLYCPCIFFLGFLLFLFNILVY